MNKNIARGLLVLFIIVIMAMDFWSVTGQPVGVDIILNESVNVTPAPAAAITTAGGSFTTLVLNVTQQNYRWKAYVGNVTGELALTDSNELRIYDWDFASISGEIYASRADNVTWGNIQCLSDPVLASEETTLNITTSEVDSINKTFENTTHKEFWVGTTRFNSSECRAIATYINDTSQTQSENAKFQEILLDDTANLVYATILEQDQYGYDENKTFDFQMIVAENKYSDTATTYYFYAELS